MNLESIVTSVTAHQSSNTNQVIDVLIAIDKKDYSTNFAIMYRDIGMVSYVASARGWRELLSLDQDYINEVKYENDYHF